MLFKNNNIQGRYSLDELIEKAANFDRRITRFKETFAKAKHRERQISAKLTAFAKWIDLMEEDLNGAQSLDDGVEKTERFVLSESYEVFVQKDGYPRHIALLNALFCVFIFKTDDRKVLNSLYKYVRYSSKFSNFQTIILKRFYVF